MEKISKKRTRKYKGVDLNSIFLNDDSDLLYKSDVLLILQRFVDHGIISSKLYAGMRTITGMKTQNPKQNQQGKRDFSRLDDNTNNSSPSNNSSILIHLSDIKGNINSIKTAIEDAFARNLIFSNVSYRKRNKVSGNDVRNLICKIFFKKNIRHNCLNINS